MSFERWLLGLRIRARSLFMRQRIEAELEEELRLHVEHLTEANIADGMDPKEARYHALRAMAGYEQQKEECRDWRGMNWLENIARDVRYAVRTLRRSPVFTVAAILSLALGIGANSAIFSLIDTLLLRPLPVPHPQKLRNVFLKTPERLNPFISHPMFQALESHNDVFTSLAAWADRQFRLELGGKTVHIDGVLATGTYFSMLGVSPERGRVFTDADDHPSGGKGGPVAVISDRFWSRQYQKSPSALGSDIVLDHIRFTVVGIMPPDFFGAEVGVHPNVWIPASFVDKVVFPGCLSSRRCVWLAVMGRMKPAVTAQRANAQLSAISGDVLRETAPPGWNAEKRDGTYTFTSVSGDAGWSFFLRLQFTEPLVILMILVGLVLLVACANLANLLLARASARHREIAVRLSVGAGRVRIIRQLLTESVVLSLAGGLAGTAFAFWLTRILIAFATKRHGPVQFTHLELHPDWRIVLFTFAVAFISGILFGLMPALRSTRLDIALSLKASAHTLRGRNGQFHFARLLVTLQTTLSVLLVAAAGLFGGSLFHLLTLNYGFNPDNVSLISVDTDGQPKNVPAWTALYTRILERVNGLPGVRAASLVFHVPLSGFGSEEILRVPGKPALPRHESDTYLNLIGPRFFQVMGTRLISGREFDSHDTATAERVGIISRLAAQRFFRGENPIGRHILLAGKPIRVVGVTEEMKYQSLRDVDRPELYLPYTQLETGPRKWQPSLTFVIKTKPGAPSPNAAFRDLLQKVAPGVPMGRAYTMQQQVDASVGQERLMASLSVFFGILALLLSAIGLYGILAYNVTRRTGEIGIRMALGASRCSVVWLVLRGAMSYALAGIVIGAIAVSAGSRLVANLLYGIQPNNPGNLLAAILALLLIAALAALFPSLRASRVDPATSLRQE